MKDIQEREGYSGGGEGNGVMKDIQERDRYSGGGEGEGV